MNNSIKVPGIVYSLILAIAAWAIDYFTTGAGGNIPWAPILIAVIPVVLKAITVQASEPEQPVSTARGFSSIPEPESKMHKFLLG